MVSSQYSRSSEIEKPLAKVHTITTTKQSARITCQKLDNALSAANAKKLALADKSWFRH
jgi:hypothetical protein